MRCDRRESGEKVSAGRMRGRNTRPNRLISPSPWPSPPHSCPHTSAHRLWGRGGVQRSPDKRLWCRTVLGRDPINRVTTNGFVVAAFMRPLRGCDPLLFGTRVRQRSRAFSPGLPTRCDRLESGEKVSAGRMRGSEDARASSELPPYPDPLPHTHAFTRRRVGCGGEGETSVVTW